MLSAPRHEELSNHDTLTTDDVDACRQTDCCNGRVDGFAEQYALEVIDIDKGIADTVRWYLANRKWLDDIVSGDYRNYYDKMYSHR